MKKYKVTIDMENCIGCGSCVSICPENFKMGDDGKATPIKSEIIEKEYPKNKEAADVCPVNVIKITGIK